MKRYISFSGGVESTTMCVLYGRGAVALFADGGIEEPEMYERIDYCDNKLKELHNGDFEIVKIKPQVTAKGVLCNTIYEAAMVWQYFPSQQARWCTKEFKIKAIDNYLSKEKERVELMIGFNAEEEPEKDRTGNFMTLSNVDYIYPLYTDGYTRKECEEILSIHGLLPNLPIYMSRGGCRTCFYKNRKELKAKYIFNPIGFLEDKQFEIDLNEKSQRSKFYSINISAGSYQSIQDEVDREIQTWGIANVKNMYKTVSPHKPCGAFCHR